MANSAWAESERRSQRVDLACHNPAMAESSKKPAATGPRKTTRNGPAPADEKHFRRLAERVAEKHARTLDKLGR